MYKKCLSNLKKLNSQAKSKTTKKRKAAGNESSFSCDICSVGEKHWKHD